MPAPTPFERLAVARAALVEANHAVGVPAAREHALGVAGASGAVAPGAGGARPVVVPTGIPALDELLGGGLPRGRVVELRGARSSGRLSLTLAMISAAVATGEPAALVDGADALDPRSLSPGDRARVLWVRAGDALTAVRCADLLLDAGGFALVAVYLVGAPRREGRGAGVTSGSGEQARRARAQRARDPAYTSGESVSVTARRGVGGASWARIAQRAERARSCVLVALDAHSVLGPGSFAHAALEVRRKRAVFRGRGPLEAVQGEVELLRSRQGRQGPAAGVLFRAG